MNNVKIQVLHTGLDTIWSSNVRLVTSKLGLIRSPTTL